ncbi:MAG: hypothetical protein Kow0074_13340 [Candidatus Zixiibacteriota bacterium]
MLRHILGAFVLLLIAASNAGAFDGIRKGLVLGGGLGAAANVSWKADFEFAPDAGENNAGFGTAIFAGYAWDERNMIVLEGNGARYVTDIGILPDVAAIQGFGGASWYHYFGDMGRSPFTVVGLGVYIFQWEYTPTALNRKNDPGPGVLIGGGYEFTDHVQVGVYIGAGRTTEPETGVEFDHGHVSVLLSAIAF